MEKYFKLEKQLTINRLLKIEGYLNNTAEGFSENAMECSGTGEKIMNFIL